jgi:catechol 2,3-dioxygenase-like lactoylglutathione lyase family enzyme
MATFLSLTPLSPGSADLDAALRFYVDHMGFEVAWRHGTMAGVRRGAIALNLVQNDDRAWAENTSYSVGTDDLEGLYEELKGLPAKVGPLEMKMWGRREFHVVDPVGVCWQFYQAPNE